MNINTGNLPQTGTAIEVVDPFDEEAFDEVDGELGFVTGKPKTASPTGWIVYLLETGEVKSARRYSVIAETPMRAVEKILNGTNPTIDSLDRITFEVFRQGSGIEFRFERTLRQVYP